MGTKVTCTWALTVIYNAKTTRFSLEVDNLQDFSPDPAQQPLLPLFSAVK